MLKHLTIALIVTAFVTGCGGSSNNNNSKSSSSKSSAAPSSVASSAATSAAVSSAATSAANSSMPASSSVASSMSSAMSSSMQSSSANIVITTDMTDGWIGEGTGNTGVTYTLEGVSFNASADGIGASFDIAAPTQLENAVIEMVVNVSSEFKTAGGEFQVFAQLNGGNYDGEWDCYTGNNELTAATDTTLTCTIDAGGVFNQTEFAVKVGIFAKGTPTGIVTIKSAKVTLDSQVSSSSSSSSSSVASSSSSSMDTGLLSIDFENDAVGKAYGYFAPGWVASPALTATVVTIASITAGSGLPSNENSLNVLKVKVNQSWDSVPVFEVTLPEGKTLANYEIHVDAYFPQDSLGLVADGSNFYKDLFLLAGIDLITPAYDTIALTPAHQSHVGSAAWDQIDIWTKALVLQVDPVKAALLTGTIQLGIGISRDAGDDADAYYLDNIVLVELP